jgi:hypothetical protein
MVVDAVLLDVGGVEQRRAVDLPDQEAGHGSRSLSEPVPASSVSTIASPASSSVAADIPYTPVSDGVALPDHAQIRD